MLRRLMRAGMDVARLNFSHGTHAEHAQRILRIRRVSTELGRPVGILQDLCGPKLRIGRMAREPLLLAAGADLILTTRPACGPCEVPLGFTDLPRLVGCGDRVLLDDGLIELRVLRTTDTDVICRVLVGGPLYSQKGINLPGVSLPIATVTAKDLRDLDFGIAQGVDWIAMSFVRRAEDLEPLRRRLRRAHADIPILAKIEKHEAVRGLEDIIAAADGAMVARGDLGVEVPMERGPLLQKEIIARCNQAGKPVITATQMLDSMIRNPRPTRAEVTDIANAIFDGTDAIMLSGETAVGKYPVAAVRYMARIATSTEGALDFEALHREKMLAKATNPTEAIGQASCDIAHDLRAQAIISTTSSGQTARMVAKNRPQTPIVGVTSSAAMQRRLTLCWGVQPIVIRSARSTDAMMRAAVRAAQDNGFVRAGDLIVLIAGVPVGVPGHTNLIKVEVVGSEEP
jgi:pyruvate kinase